jgi:protein disulfide-isomerase A6
LCANYAHEFRYVAELFARSNATSSSSLVFVEVPDARATPNATGAFNAKSAPFVALLKKNRWYYVTPQGETKIREPTRFKGALNAKETVDWLNYALGREPGARVSVPPVVDELTMDTIDDYVNDDENDVVVEFYAKWCGHCQAFEKDYEQIGAHYFRERRANNRRVKIARIDVDNARPAAIKYKITGLPTVQLFPRGHKTKGLPFPGAKKTTQLVIDFIESPDVALYDMKIKDMEPWQCFDWLREERLITFNDLLEKAVAGEEVTPTECDDIVNSVFKFAHAHANRQQWREAMIITMCMAATKALKNTPSGNSAAIWNLLDNAKFHVENPSTDDDEQARDAERAEYTNGDGEIDWKAFRSDQAAAWRREREKLGQREGDADSIFDDEEWFDFASPEEGGAPVEIPRDEL